jgi:hypothetical protein
MLLLYGWHFMFHFKVSHLQEIVHIFSRERKAFLSLSITCQVGFILDTVTIIATRTLMVTVGYSYLTWALHIHQIVSYVPYISKNSFSIIILKIATFHNKPKLLIHLRENKEGICIIILKSTAAVCTKIFSVSCWRHHHSVSVT